MLGSIARKGRQVLADPVLRRWMLRRALKLEAAPPAFQAGRPPYLRFSAVAPENAQWNGAGPLSDFPLPAAPIRIALAGTDVELSPGDPGALFRRRYDDLETMLSAHRFAWVPVAGRRADRSWVAALWTAWMEDFGDEPAGWPWHPYTATERAINIIDFARRHGLPGDPEKTVAALARHAQAIAANLEYFGEHYTSNHLANNGRGLLRIGTALGMDECIRMGLDILFAEADRIFGTSGVLCEASTHYHLLLARNYADAWLEADHAALPEAAILRDVAARALAAAPALRLSGGLPLIGDISPDCPPAYLAGLASTGARDESGSGWPGGLEPDRRAAFEALRAMTGETAREVISGDGWHRFGTEGWDALAFVPEDGWVPMPGHGHQDLGAFELHHGEERVVVDPGRGSYGPAAADRFYQSSAAHAGLTVDGEDPAPVNRPYYSDAFRRRIVPDAPHMKYAESTVTLTHSGYRRLRGVGSVTRTWHFRPAAVTVSDRVEGQGTRRIARKIVTPYQVRLENGRANIDTGTARFRISMGAAISAEETVCWTAYGAGTPGTALTVAQSAPLPFDGTITIERL